MNKTYKFRTVLIIIAAVVFALSACKPSGTLDDGGYVYEGTATAAPFTVHDESGEAIGTHGNLFLAVRAAGGAGSTSNRTYVRDAAGLEVFRYQSNSQYYMYDGTNYVGTAPSTQALNWGKTRERCYIVNGRGTDYMYLGEKRMLGSSEPLAAEYELFAGSYNYMFSKVGTAAQGDSEPGFGYMTCYVRLSEATYKASIDGQQWNAYIFINHKGNYNRDLGIIGNNGKWRLIIGCSHQSYDGGYEGPPSWPTVTEMTLDPSTGIYSGADDLFFEVIATEDGWVQNVTNMRTGITYTNDLCDHKDINKGQTQNFRFLLAASYCPVTENLWNARSGAFLKNVVFDNVKIARWRADGDYSAAQMFDFYPKEPTFNYGYAQGADCADFEYGTRGANGEYASGATYSAGDKYISFSTYYED